MSTQYTDTTPTYCSSCQALGEYPGWETTITACGAQNQYITNEFFNQAAARLNNLHNFGDYDFANRTPTLVYIRKNDNETIQPDFFNILSQSITQSSSNDKSSNGIIYGTYFTNLKDTINNASISYTRYWICHSQNSYDCCDCHGTCSCYGECTCYGECACYASGCTGGCQVCNNTECYGHGGNPGGGDCGSYQH